MMNWVRHAELSRDPLKYGYYQFRFMAGALRDRQQFDFSKWSAGEGAIIPRRKVVVLDMRELPAHRLCKAKI